MDTAERLAASYVFAHAAPSEPVVTTGFRRAVFAYYLDRAGGHPGPLLSFPREIAEHPGWYREDRLLADPTRLAQEGARLAADLISLARQGHTVWILTSDPSNVDPYLYRELSTALTIDRDRSNQDLQILCLRLR